MSMITNTDNIQLSNKIASKTVRVKIAKLVKRLLDIISMRRELEAEEAKDKSELKELLKPAYFQFNEDATAPEDVYHTFDVGPLQVNFVNAYVIKDDAHAQSIAKLLGAKHPLLSYIKESKKIVIDVSNLSPANANQLATAVTNSSAYYNIKPTVERNVTVDPEFHSMRHVVLTSADNQELDKVLPMQIQAALI